MHCEAWSKTARRSRDTRRERLLTNLLIRNLDDAVLKRLRAAAKGNLRSLEDEVRAALRMGAVRHAAETRRLSASWLDRLRTQR